jgi:hypothetical protein
VVGEHDDAVGPRHLRGGPNQPGQLVVQPAQGVHGVVPFDAGVVRDLVVADEVGIDDGTAGAHVADQGGDDDVAGQHGGEGPEQRVDAAAVHPWSDVAPALRG